MGPSRIVEHWRAMGNVQSVERAMAILRCLSNTEAGVSQIAELVDLPKSTVSRLLATLHDLGAVSATDSGFRIGPLMSEIAAAADQHDGLATLAAPYLAGLVDAVGEDAGLSVLDNGDTLYLVQIGASAAVQLRDWTGERVPPHCVSSGLVLLAHASDAERNAALEAPLAQFTAKTMTAPAKLRRRLTAIAKRGTEWVYGEFVDDINSVASPVIDVDGHAIAALHVHGPSYRFPGERNPDSIAHAVATAARQLSERLAR